MSDYMWLPIIQVTISQITSDYEWRMNVVITTKNVGELDFIIISGDNSHVAGGKQKGSLTSNNHC